MNNAITVRRGLIAAKKEITRLCERWGRPKDVRANPVTRGAMDAIKRALDEVEFYLQEGGRCVVCGNLSEKDACNKCKKRPCEEDAFVLNKELICSECITEDEFRAWVGETCPEAVHTLEWDEHPEDFEDPCFCSTCRSYD